MLAWLYVLLVTLIPSILPFGLLFLAYGIYRRISHGPEHKEKQPAAEDGEEKRMLRYLGLL